MPEDISVAGFDGIDAGEYYIPSITTVSYTHLILLAVMILPTVVGVTESAITSVPESYYEASLGPVSYTHLDVYKRQV